MTQEVWLHYPTMTLALVQGNHGEFVFNGHIEESFWGLFRYEDHTEHGWVYVGEFD